MREIQRSALVPYTPAQMFALVDDFERYAEFLPWVSGAELLERTDTQRVGRISVARAGFHEHFTTRNTVQAPQRLEMQLIDGPFHVLHGVWTFDAIGSLESARGSRIALVLNFELKNRLADMLLAKKIETSCDTLVDAFVRRARQVYAVAD